MCRVGKVLRGAVRLFIALTWPHYTPLRKALSGGSDTVTILRNPSSSIGNIILAGGMEKGANVNSDEGAEQHASCVQFPSTPDTKNLTPNRKKPYVPNP